MCVCVCCCLCGTRKHTSEQGNHSLLLFVKRQTARGSEEFHCNTPLTVPAFLFKLKPHRTPQLLWTNTASVSPHECLCGCAVQAFSSEPGNQGNPHDTTADLRKRKKQTQESNRQPQLARNVAHSDFRCETQLVCFYYTHCVGLSINQLYSQSALLKIRRCKVENGCFRKKQLRPERSHHKSSTFPVTKEICMLS